MIGMASFLLATLEFLAVAAVSFIMIALGVSFLRYEKQALQYSSSVKDAFLRHFSIILRTAQREKSSATLVLIKGTVEDRLAVLENENLKTIKAVLRRDDVVMGVDNQVGLILQAPKSQIYRILPRVRQALTPLLGNAGAPAQLSFSMAGYPEDGDRAEILWDRAVSSASAEWPAETPATTPADGLWTLPQWMEEGERLASRCRRNGEPVSVIKTEVDHLPRYVERYGAGVVSEIRQSVSSIVRGCVRGEDAVGCLENGELVVLLPCRVREAMIIAERITSAVKDGAVTYADAALKVTVSVGVAGLPENGVSLQHLLEASSAALSEAFTKGGGQCRWYAGSLSPAHQVDEHPASTF
jgi:diguanylate cyclase (GGDEF)-like protein